MDRDLVNNQIILMRKSVRNVKRLVKQKLNKQLKKLELRLNKNIEKSAKKLQNKMNNKKKELISINGINVDEVSKQALIQNKKYFEDIIKNSKSSVESKALARIAINENIEKVVNKFKDENPNCDQWLPSQIELWQQKKAIKKNKILKKKGLLNSDQQNDIQLETQTDIQSKAENLNPKEINKTEVKSKENIEKKEKKTPKKEAKKKTAVDTKQVSVVIEEKVEVKPKSDPFFLSKDSNLDEESDEESDSDQKKWISKMSFRDQKFKQNDKRSKFSKTSGKSNSLQNRKNFRPKKFENKTSNRDNNSNMVSVEEVDPSLHPSWAAKRSAKDKIKINFNSKPLAKKIKFSDQ